jgi:glycosyltransferase involved in cell wall biosynthesis
VDNTWIIIPAFNEERVIRQVVDETLSFTSNVAVINDGSSDGTREVIEGSGAWVISHPINLGQGAALQTGMSFAIERGADVICMFDADGQHDIRDVEKMVSLLKRKQLDAVLGSRFLGTTVGMKASRKILLKLAVIFTWITSGVRLTDAHNGLRVFSREGAMKISLRHNGMAHASEIVAQIAQHKLRFEEFPNTITYTDYSMAKGQKALSTIRIVFDLILDRLVK